MRDILIIAHFAQVPGERGNDRFHYIAERMSAEGTSAELVTTTFSHLAKTQRQLTERQLNSINYKLTMLYEPGYLKNVSINRLYSHYKMGKSLEKYLRNRKKPDVLYCAVPSLSVAKVAAMYANEQGIRFIVDIQDLWPEAFRMVFNLPVVSDVLFEPMKRAADYIYSSADAIVAVSQTYAKRGLKASGRWQKANVVFLGTDLDYFDRLARADNPLVMKPSNEVWLAYVGTLGHSYEITSVIEALALVKDTCNVRLMVMGDGPLERTFEEYAKERGVAAVFTGRLAYGNMVSILTMCDIAVNPIAKGSAASIINKVGDYAAAGLPVINTQECEEYRQLLEAYSAGINCDTVAAMARAIEQLCTDHYLRRSMGRNSRKLGETYFDRGQTYGVIVDLING